MAEKSTEPKLKEIGITCSAGGKVKIVRFDVESSYFVSGSRTYDIPDNWTNEEAEEFQLREFDRLRDPIDKRADEEFNERFEQSYLSD